MQKVLLTCEDGNQEAVIAGSPYKFHDVNQVNDVEPDLILLFKDGMVWITKDRQGPVRKFQCGG